MATLSQLRTRIAAKLSDGTLLRPDATEIDQAVNAAIDFYENKYFWFQEALAALSTIVDDPILGGIPSDFKFQQHPNSLVLLNNNFRYPLQHVTPIELDQLSNDVSTGLPSVYTYRTGQFELYQIPQEIYTVNLYYYKTYADLVADGDSNDFTTKAERLIEYKTLLDLIGDYKPEDERYILYTAKVKEEYDIIENETYNRTSTGRLTTENIAEYSSGNYYNHRRNY